MGELDGWRHCPVCATAIEPEEGRVECPECGFVTFAHSMPTASAVVDDGQGRVLLSRRANDPSAGKWDLPGGFVEEGEHPLDCLRRELREEAGIGLADEQLLGIWMDQYDYKGRRVATLNVYYTARVGEGTPMPADDVAELRWFALSEVPTGELAFAHIRDVLSAWNEDA
ncbi:MAG TPA: NUDIX hydrolase [Gaiellaceae bacterium]|nr:NUDIX hydrolase [Gaiellaceae bacterium]